MIDLAKARAICEAATPGPWSSDYIYTALRFHQKCGNDVGDEPWYKPEIRHPSKDDNEFIAFARTALPEALDEIDQHIKHHADLCEEMVGKNAEIESLRTENAELKSRLAGVEK